MAFFEASSGKPLLERVVLQVGGLLFVICSYVAIPLGQGSIQTWRLDGWWAPRQDLIGLIGWNTYNFPRDTIPHIARRYQTCDKTMSHPLPDNAPPITRQCPTHDKTMPHP